MTDIVKTALPEPRFLDRPAFLLAGLALRIGSAETSSIPALWQRFAPHFGHLPHQVGHDAYGLCRDMDEAGRIEYVASVEVARFEGLPPDFTQVRVPAAGYAVFRHEGHVSTLRHSFAAIYDDWLPASGRRAGGPDFERYGPSFDPATGSGGLEIWIALAP